MRRLSTAHPQFAGAVAFALSQGLGGKQFRQSYRRPYSSTFRLRWRALCPSLHRKRNDSKLVQSVKARQSISTLWDENM